MTTTSIPQTEPSAMPSLDWPALAGAYRGRVTRLLAGFARAKHLPDLQADVTVNALNSEHAPHYDALIAYPVSTPAELAEKIALIAIDCWDEEPAFKAIAADAQRLAGASA